MGTRLIMAIKNAHSNSEVGSLETISSTTNPKKTGEDSGYGPNTEYTWGFYGDMAPISLNHLVMMNGLSPVDLDKPFTFLELGCGQGLTSNIFADLYPHASFHAVDAIKQHIANARAVAQASKLSNIVFHESTFEKLELANLPDFDFIVLHGVFSWVRPEIRDQIIAIIKSKLKPGGYCYVSYNAMPGWSPLMPLREYMNSYAGSLDKPLLQKAQESLNYMKFLLDNQAGYFEQNPIAKSHFLAMHQHDVTYISHEYFTSFWEPIYAPQAAACLLKGDCHYIGSLPFCMNIPDLSTPPAFRKMLATAPNRLVFELHRSFILNERFRRDVFVKAPARRLTGDIMSDWGDVLFGPSILPENLSFSRQFPIGEVEFSSRIYQILSDILLDGVNSFADLMQQETLALMGSARVLTALKILCAGHQFSPFRCSYPPRPASGAKVALASRLSRYLLETQLCESNYTTLSLSVRGNGEGIDVVNGVYLLACDIHGYADIDWAVQFIDDKGGAFSRDHATPLSFEQKRLIIEENFNTVKNKLHDRFIDLGVLVERPSG